MILTVSLAFTALCTALHEWCHFSQIRLPYLIAIFIVVWIKNELLLFQGTPSEPIYIAQGWHIWNTAHCVVSTHKQHLSSKPYLHKWVKKGTLVCKLGVHIYFLPCSLNETHMHFIRNKQLILFQKIQNYGHTVGGLVNWCDKFTALQSAVKYSWGWGRFVTGISSWETTIIKVNIQTGISRKNKNREAQSYCN